jgi:hypothetical protein
VGNSPQSTPGYPGSAAFITGDWSPPPCDETLTPSVYTATNGARTCDHYDAGSTISCAVESYVSIRDHLYIGDAESGECFPHTRTQFFSPGARQTDFRGDKVAPAHFRYRARFVDRFTHCPRCTGNSNPQRI